MIDTWIVAVCSVISLFGHFAIANRRSGARDQKIDDHERRITGVEYTIAKHTSTIGWLRGSLHDEG